MKKRMKQLKQNHLLQVTLTVAMCLSATFVQAQDIDSDFIVDGLVYRINLILDDDEKTVTVVHYDYNSEPRSSYSIPEIVSYGGNNYFVTDIGEDAFSGCKKLKNVTIGNAVKTIGNYAFFGCDHLVSVKFGKSVESIGGGAFWCCKYLKSLTIPNSVHSIGYQAFKECIKLEYVTMGNSVETIEVDAFENCDALKKVFISDLEAWCNIDFQSIHSNPLGGSLPFHDTDPQLFLNGAKITDLVIPEGIKRVKPNAFYGCGIKTVVIPNSVTCIDYDAFLDCVYLVDVSIGNAVDTINYDAFDNCRSLKRVNIPKSVKFIGIDAFRGAQINQVDITDLEAWCNIDFDTPMGEGHPFQISYLSWPSDTCYLYLNGSPIKDLVIPNGIQQIKPFVFYGFNGMRSAVIPESVTVIGERAFEDCRGLEKVTISNSVHTIAEAAFMDCQSLEKVTLGNHLELIGLDAFSGCISLTSIKLPKTVREIRNGAFAGCSALKSIISLPLPPPTLKNSVFYNVDKSIPVYVLDIDVYKNAPEWKDFTNYQKYESSKNGDLTGDMVVDVDDLNLVINMMLHKTEKTEAADLNGDGAVDVDDLNIIINIMVGKD